MPDSRPDPRLAEIRALLEQNRLEQARELCRQMCQLDPADAEALYILGTIEVRLNGLERAEACFRGAVGLTPDKAEFHFALGKALELQGKATEAEAAYRRAIALDAAPSLHHFRLGNALLAQERYGEAAAAYRQALTLDGQLAAAHTNLGAALMHQDDLAGAERSIRTALDLAPDMGEAHHLLGDVLNLQGRTEAAHESYRRALACGASRAETHNNLGCLLFDQYRLEEAAAQFREAIRLNPKLANAYYNLSAALQEMGHPREAIAVCKEALRLNPSYVTAYNHLGRLHISQGDIGAALSCYRHALALDPDDDAATAGLAQVYEVQGDWQRAWDTLRPLVEDERRRHHAAPLFGRLCKRLGNCTQAARLLDEVLEHGAITAAQRASLLFQAGAVYDGLGEFDQAFARIDAGNHLKNRRFDLVEHSRLIDALIATFPTAPALPGTADAGRHPIFIVGMPRSGTTLVEQILSRHPAVHGGGELPELGDVAALLEQLTGTPYPAAAATITPAQREQAAGRYRSRLAAFETSAPYVTDKMPANYLHLGLIALLFPDARIVHCLRDPRDTCLSCYFQDFLGRENYFSFDLTTLGRYYAEYRRLMSHWQHVVPLPMLEVRYEELVANQERVTRALVDFCGLEWDERCLSFHQSRRIVSTVSYNQVREPLYRRSVGRWRHYARHLEPLLTALGEWARD